jgi:O-antigen ligase
MRALAAILLLLLVGLSPFWLGSNRPLVWAVNAAAAGLVLVLAGIGILFARRSHPLLHLDRIAVPLVMVAGVLVWALFQTVPFGGSGHPAWEVAAGALGRDLDAMISVSPTETWWALTRWLTAGAVFLAAFSLSRDAALAGLVLRGFLVFAVLAAIYGLVRLSLGIDRILWFDVPTRRFLTSGFINQNNAATFFGMSALAAFALVLEGLRRIVREAGSRRERMQLLFERLGGSFGVDLALFLVLLVTVFATVSRGGLLATFAGLSVLMLVFGVKMRQGGGLGGANWTFVLLFAGVLVLAVVEMSGYRILERLSAQGLEESRRLDTYGQLLRAIPDYAWQGSGLGTFQEVFPAYRLEIDPLRHVWDKAHNDYLELLLGLGLPAALAMLIALGLLVVRALVGFFERRRDAHYAAAAVGVGVVAAVHSLVDFPLQIQANGLAFALILGVGVAQSFSSRG